MISRCGRLPTGSPNATLRQSPTSPDGGFSPCTKVARYAPSTTRSERLGLMRCSRSLLFRFLEASVHPTTVDETTQKARVERINAHLQHDGYRLTRTGSMSGSPIYSIAAHAISSQADAAISSVLKRFEPDQIHARWTAALDRRSTDPAGAITLARTLLEDVCRWLLEELGQKSRGSG